MMRMPPVVLATLAAVLFTSACATPPTEPVTAATPSTQPTPATHPSPSLTADELRQARIDEIDQAYPGAAEFITLAEEKGWDEEEFANASWMDSPHQVADYAPVDSDFPALLYALSALAELEGSIKEGEYWLFLSVRNHNLYLDGAQRDVVTQATEIFAPEIAEHVDPMAARLEGGFSGGACNETCMVGEDIQPGTYQATTFDGSLFTDAYWEVAAPDGQIIDNAFITSAQQVTVTIPAHAGQFTASGFGLGFWAKAS